MTIWRLSLKANSTYVFFFWGGGGGHCEITFSIKSFKSMKKKKGKKKNPQQNKYQSFEQSFKTIPWK